MINREHLQQLLEQERRHFIDTHPRSYELHQQAKSHLHEGVPMNWMVRWAGHFPLFVTEANGARFTDVDGREYIDLCLGDTGAMTGHAPSPALGAIAAQLKRGITFMLPVEDSIWVSEELSRRFGLPYWQFALTATDANRFSIRLARHITKRPKILVFNWCYHGTVDETFITLNDGIAGARPGNIGAPVDPTITTKVIEFNDISALEAALAEEDVACVLAEPVMTNIGIVHPEEGFHEALREITRRTGTLLIIDETHTLCSGVGGYTGENGLQPDFVTVGKAIASGIPAAAYGFTEEVAQRIHRSIDRNLADVGGIGGTLAGNALSIAAIKATLQHVLTEDAYSHSIPLAERFTEGVQEVIDETNLPWHMTRLGCRAEYWFRPTPPRNGGEAAASVDDELDEYMHLAALNRGILMTPFHNMALMSPATTQADVDYHTRVFRMSVQSLLS